MRTTERLRKLKTWVESELCSGREMKAPGKNMRLTEFSLREPKCYLAWAPAYVNRNGAVQRAEIESVCPSIIVMPNQAYAKYTEEHRFDRYNNIVRPQELGQHLAVSMLFVVYEPGIRASGFYDGIGRNGEGIDADLLMDGTEQGLFTLLDWMDDATEKLLRDKFIPESDLFLEENSLTYSLYTDQEYVTDRRPMYYGFINATFACYASEGVNTKINNLLL